MTDPPDVPAAGDGEPEAAPWRTLRKAAAVSISSMSARLAAEALTMVPSDHPDRLELLADQARSKLVLGEFDEASEAAVAAIEPGEVTPVAIRSNATLALASALQHGPSDLVDPLMIEDLAEVVARFPSEPQRGELAVALADLSLIEVLSGRSHDAAQTGTTAIGLAPTDRVVVASHMAICLDAVLDGRFDEALRGADRMMTTFERSAEQIEIVGYGFWMIDAVVRSALGATDEALASVAEGRRMTNMIEIPLLQMNFAIAELATLFAAGRWDELLSSCERSLAHADEYGNRMWRTWLHAFQSLVHARRGEPAAAAEALRAGAESTTSLGVGAEHVTWAQATAARYRGDDREALELLRRSHEMFVARGQRVGPTAMFLDLVRLECEHGSTARATASLDALTPVDDTLTTPAALLAGANGVVAGDHRQVAMAAASLDAVFPFEAARLHHDAARLAASNGDRAVAAAQVRRADSLLIALGASAERAVLASWATNNAMPGPVARIERLTPAERRVVALVRAGNSNKHIATTLGLSTRTVETHLTRIYAKLGIDSRLRLVTSDEFAGDADT
jgi:DNA-binding NarL/FixJ family response regulator